MEAEIYSVYQYVLNKKVLPSMRSLQFGGKPIEIQNSRIYNCSFVHINDWRVFGEAMLLLLQGVGVGYSVQKHHVDSLPEIHTPTKNRKYLIEDSITGWALSIEMLIKSYMRGKPAPIFDYREIRPKGAELITAGGKAPGPEPLKDCHHNIRKILDRAISERGEGIKLKTLECHDILCYIANAVLAGGIRRSACIAIFSPDDEDMITCKYGNWYELNEQRARSNNSMLIKRDSISQQEFMELWKKVEMSGTGEPAIIWTNNLEYGYNPCVEASLEDCTFCNLTTVNVSDVEDENDFIERCKAASFIGTLQSSYTDFHFLRDKWRHNCEKKPLLGVSMTGIASNKLIWNLESGSKAVVDENIRVAKLINVKPALRTTCVKPEGTVSCVVGSSSGIHAWHNDYYIRRIRLGKDEALYKYLVDVVPNLVVDDVMNSKQAIMEFPIKAPKDATLRYESPIDLLNRVKRINQEWIRHGHIEGDNTHNSSCTVSIKNDEWETIGNWLWDNKEYYNGLSVLPFDGGHYYQTPFEDCTKEEYESRISQLKMIDLTNVIEDNNNVTFVSESACAGGACELK